MPNNTEQTIKELAEKYESIKKQVEEYNNMASLAKISARVGCIINEVSESEDDDDENSYYEDLGFSYSGWMPSSVGC